jgi:hypothetical protein
MALLIGMVVTTSSFQGVALAADRAQNSHAIHARITRAQAERLVAGGHHVVATSWMRNKIDWRRAQGVDPMIVDCLDKDQTTAIASTLDLEAIRL